VRQRKKPSIHQAEQENNIMPPRFKTLLGAVIAGWVSGVIIIAAIKLATILAE
jgi:hypothetical protein